MLGGYDHTSSSVLYDSPVAVDGNLIVTKRIKANDLHIRFMSISMTIILSTWLHFT